MRLSRFLALAAAGFIGVGSLYAAHLVWSQRAESADRAATAGSAATIGGPFAMVDDEGRRVTEADLTGRPTVLFFGFTWCPDICPTTLFTLTGLIEELGADADALDFVMVTADPERDTPEILNEYLSAFDPRFRGFTGTPEEVAGIAKAYDVRIERVGTGVDYTVNHTASVYLMDRGNGFVGTISSHEDPTVSLAKLRRLANAA